MPDDVNDVNDDQDLLSAFDNNELEAYLQQKFGTDQTGGEPAPEPGLAPAPDEEEVEDQPDEDEEEEAEAEEDEQEQESFYRVQVGTNEDGTPRTHDFSGPELVAFYQFQQRLAADPLLAHTLSNWDPTQQQPPSPAPGGVQPPPASPPPGTLIPEDVDTDDPNVKFLLEQNRLLSEQVTALSGSMQTTAAQWQAAQLQQINGLVQTAERGFAEKYELTAEQSKQISDVAGRMGVIAAYMNGVNPITGLPVVPNAMEAVNTALEAAIWTMPEYRSKIIDSQTNEKIKTTREDKSRKQKLTALSGSPGSSNRNAPPPQTEAERRDAMAAEIAAAMGFN